MEKTDYRLTERGFYWLKIDLANTYGEDKIGHDEQVKWSEDIINRIYEDCDIQFKIECINKADSPFEFKQCLENYENYRNNKPINGLMYVDCSNQALQCYAVLTGDLKTAEVCNLAGNKNRADGYQMLADSINSHFSEPFITRSDTKKPMMTTLYGKQKAWESMINKLEENLEDVDISSSYFSDKIDKIFKDSMDDIAQNAMRAMAKIQDLNNEKIGTYYWSLPDGFKVRYDVKSENKIKAERTTKNGIKIKIEDTISEYKPNKFNAGMAPNVIHSVDAYICREVIKRFEGFITTIHDAYAVHYNYIDDLISIYKDIMIEILESELLNDIMLSISGDRSYVPLIKSKTLNKFHIRKSEYALT